MTRQLLSSVGFGLLFIVGLVSQVSAECLTARGEISNNAQLDGSTLGVVSLKLHGMTKLNCGIVGVPQNPGPPDFRHTVVCDDKASPDEAQAQVTLNTSFLSPPSNVIGCPVGSPGGAISFSFEEISTPDPNSARGAFQGITEDGSIIITGNFNCDGGIVMEFNGEICFED